MKIVRPNYYKKFNCIAGECPDSCCQGWEVDVDSDSLNFYKNLNHPISKTIKNLLDKDEFGNDIFTLTKNKRCPFLNNQNLCDMHIAIGGEHTPITCRNFPRYFNDYGGTIEMGISFSCPVATNLMWNNEDVTGRYEEINPNFPNPNDIDPNLYFDLIKFRKEIFNMIDNNNISNLDIVKFILNYSYKFENDEHIEKTNNCTYFDLFNNPELINKEWTKIINLSKFSIDYEIFNGLPNRNVIFYFVYRYLLQGVFDGNVIEKIKMIAVGSMLTSFFNNDSWAIHLWSKETEHSDVNMDRFVKLLNTSELFSINNLIKKLGDS